MNFGENYVIYSRPKSGLRHQQPFKTAGIAEQHEVDHSPTIPEWRSPRQKSHLGVSALMSLNRRHLQRKVERWVGGFHQRLLMIGCKAATGSEIGWYKDEKLPDDCTQRSRDLTDGREQNPWNEGLGFGFRRTCFIFSIFKNIQILFLYLLSP